MSPIDKNHILNVAVESALAASDIIMEGLNKRTVIDFKGPTNLVTDIDYKSEDIIKKIILHNFPDHNILAEESKNQNNNKSDYLWIIDPLDGTTNFVHGYPSFAVSIAVSYKRILQVAAVLEMPHKKIYSAIKNQGAWCEGVPIKTSSTETIEHSLFVTGFGYIHEQKWEMNMELFKYFTHISQGVRRLGAASVDLCHLASGAVDGFWEFDLKPWDTAAGVLIAQESGCEISNLNGKPYDIFHDNILATNGKIHTLMVKEIKSYLN